MSRFNKILIGLLVFFAFFFVIGAAKGSQTLPISPVESNAKSCSTISPSRYNDYLRLRGKITGKPYTKLIKSKPVCINPHFRNLKKSIKKSRKTCKKKAIKTGASYYDWGDNTPAGSNAGKWGDLHDYSFAELGGGYAMGGLKPNSWWYIAKVNGKHSVRGEKRDYGTGGGNINGYTRGIDLWLPLRNAVGLSDNGVVYVSKRDCWAKLKNKK